MKRASWRKLQVCLRDAGRARARKGEAQELLNGNNLKPIKTNLHIQYIMVLRAWRRMTHGTPTAEFRHTTCGWGSPSRRPASPRQTSCKRSRRQRIALSASCGAPATLSSGAESHCTLPQKRPSASRSWPWKALPSRPRLSESNGTAWARQCHVIRDGQVVTGKAGNSQFHGRQEIDRSMGR